MEKEIAKDDDEAAASGPSGNQYDRKPDETAAAAARWQPAIEREPERRRRPMKLGESLHAWIVHFDAARSSGPPSSDDED